MSRVCLWRVGSTSPASIPDPVTVPLLQKLLRLPSDTGTTTPWFSCAEARRYALATALTHLPRSLGHDHPAFGGPAGREEEARDKTLHQRRDPHAGNPLRPASPSRALLFAALALFSLCFCHLHRCNQAGLQSGSCP